MGLGRKGSKERKSEGGTCGRVFEYGIRVALPSVEPAATCSDKYLATILPEKQPLDSVDGKIDGSSGQLTVSASPALRPESAAPPTGSTALPALSRRLYRGIESQEAGALLRTVPFFQFSEAETPACGTVVTKQVHRTAEESDLDHQHLSQILHSHECSKEDRV